MVGALGKPRSVIENCWFSIRTTPRFREEDFKTLKLIKEPTLHITRKSICIFYFKFYPIRLADTHCLNKTIHLQILAN